MKGITMGRRDFLKLSLVTAGAVALSGCKVASDYPSRVKQLREPMAANATWQEILRYATLAPNGHNTQPWKFVLGGKSVEIHPDATRHLAVVDANDREQFISLGCALENLLLAARAAGFAGEVSYPGDGQDFVRVNFESAAPSTNALFDAIPHRQSVRSEYSGQALAQEALTQIYATTLEPGVELHFIADEVGLEKTLELVNEGNKSQYGDQAFLDELISWLRFNEKEAMSTQDGLFSRCSGNPTVPRWLGSMFVGGTKPQTQADADAKKVRSSAGMVAVASLGDDKAAWVKSGQVFERLSLTMTSVGVSSALLNQPIEVAELRSQFQNALAFGNAAPQLLLRFGMADEMPWSLRRPVEAVIL